MTSERIGFACFCLLAALPLARAGTVVAQDSARRAATQVSAWPTVSDSRLDTMRGGFDAGGGLLASFGIAHAVYVNGSLVSSTSVYIPDISRMTPDQAQALMAATGVLNVVQNGPGNSFDVSALDQAIAATVIQNSLDNQNIRSLTTIDASVNNLNTFRELNTQASLQAALLGSLGH